MKKIFALTALFVAGLAFSANAGQISNGQMAKCNDAKSITLEAATLAKTIYNRSWDHPTIQAASKSRWGLIQVMNIGLKSCSKTQ